MLGGFTSFKEEQRNVLAEPPYPGQDETHSLEKILPLELIRQHTKTDDNPAVTDELLDLYRQAAMEACELYTGRIWGRAEIRREPVSQAINRRRRLDAQFTTVELSAPVADGVLYLYGGGILKTEMVRVEKGATRVRIPVLQVALDASSCCNPCGDGGRNWGIMAMYRTGTDNPAAVPAGIKQGMLKMIAWSVENPGDVLKTVKNSERATASGLIGTNDAAFASGAVEHWRMYVPSAI